MSDNIQETTASNAPAPEAQQLQLSDILLAAQIIQLASTRAAFKVEEFTQVGSLYERLVSFLQTTGAIKAPDAPTTPVEQTQGN